MITVTFLKQILIELEKTGHGRDIVLLASDPDGTRIMAVDGNSPFSTETIAVETRTYKAVCLWPGNEVRVIP